MANDRVRGIDVSHHDGNIDWTRVKGAGVEFAFAKATEGADPTTSWYKDPTFAANWQRMKDAGITRGAYHFIGLPLATTVKANWNDDIHRQIDHFLDVVGPLDSGDLAPVLDLEDGDSPTRWSQLIKTDRKGAISIVRELIQYTAAQLDGVTPIIYTGSFWWSQLGDPDAAIDNMPFGDFPLWFAQYPRVHRPNPLPGSPGATDSGEASTFDEYDATPSLSQGQPSHIPKVWGGPANPKWTIWQFSSFGTINGITGFVDMNVLNGTMDDLDRLTVATDPPSET